MHLAGVNIKSCIHSTCLSLWPFLLFPPDSPTFFACLSYLFLPVLLTCPRSQLSLLPCPSCLIWFLCAMCQMLTTSALSLYTVLYRTDRQRSPRSCGGRPIGSNTKIHRGIGSRFSVSHRKSPPHIQRKKVGNVKICCWNVLTECVCGSVVKHSHQFWEDQIWLWP